MATHSLISPSNFERRMLCPGSLNAEKDLPDVPSKYSAEGTMLHEKTKSYLELYESYNVYLDYVSIRKFAAKGMRFDWGNAPAVALAIENILGTLTDEQKKAVRTAADYIIFICDNDEPTPEIIHNFHERTFDLSFIYPAMKGTADSVLLIRDFETETIAVHIIDYKFGRGVAVSAYRNFQLILYYLGVINNPDIKLIIEGKKTTVHLHIVQPFVQNSRWDLTEDERLEIENLQFYQDVANACYEPNAKRIANKKACQFCKAKPTCPALAKSLPNLDVDIFNLEDEEIAAIYDNRELTKLYLSSIEEYIRNKISDGGFKGYELVDKISNRKWVKEAATELAKFLGDDAFEASTKLITIGAAEKILGRNSDVISKLTMKEVIGTEIAKISNNQK